MVGNSGGLLLRDDGEEIDRHEMVLRFNAAPTMGYEHQVLQDKQYSARIAWNTMCCWGLVFLLLSCFQFNFFSFPTCAQCYHHSVAPLTLTRERSWVYRVVQ